MAISIYGELKYHCDTGQDETKWQSVWRITISVLMLDRKNKMAIVMENYYQL